ncbi:MAG: YicC/YloC family endoribonuclease [Hyphomicrobium sp.]|nr:YicC/YloC family endoribonuclease [Hyphomicrobium sp.]
MAVNSMTGFARADGAEGGVRWFWEVRSVNGRGLDVRLKLAPGFDALDPKVREAVARTIQRGSVSITLFVQREATAPAMRVNEAALAQIIQAVDRVRTLTGAPPPSAEGLLALRGVLEIDDQRVEGDDQRLHEMMLTTLQTALSGLSDVRRSEGARLSDLVAGQINEVDRLAAIVRESPARRPERIQMRLRELVQRLLDSANGFDPERLHQEAVLVATRTDVEEELQRLAVHTESVQELIVQGGAIGRKLDFVAQELNREANTLTSKAIDVEITRAGLAMKAVIDQLREQVQNIE